MLFLFFVSYINLWFQCSFHITLWGRRFLFIIFSIVIWLIDDLLTDDWFVFLIALLGIQAPPMPATQFAIKCLAGVFPASFQWMRITLLASRPKQPTVSFSSSSRSYRAAAFASAAAATAAAARVNLRKRAIRLWSGMVCWALWRSWFWSPWSFRPWVFPTTTKCHRLFLAPRVRAAYPSLLLLLLFQIFYVFVLC